MPSYFDHYKSEEAKFTDAYVARYSGFYEMERFIKRETLLAGKRLAVPLPKLLKFDAWEEASTQGSHNVLPAYIDELLAPSSISYIDTDEDLLREAERKHGTKDRTYVLGTVQDLPFENDTFDMVVDFSTSDHVLDDNEFARTIGGVSRVLKSGGAYVLYHDNAEYICAANFWRDGDFPVSHARSAKYVRRVLEDNRFVVDTHWFIYPFLYDKTMVWHRLVEASKLGRRLMPASLKHRFFNSPRYNMMFFFAARCQK